MALPLIILSGQAGSGKDTIASFLVKNHGAVAIAQADPMKRFVRDVGAFTVEQLWGPSEARNAIDPRVDDENFRRRFISDVEDSAEKFVREVLPHGHGTKNAELALIRWAQKLMSSNEHISPRLVLQTLGTEYGRTVSRDMWVEYAKRDALKLLSGGYAYDRAVGVYEDLTSNPSYVVITDGRFRNELVSVLSLGGQTWKISTPGEDGSAALAAGVKGHRSETEMKTIPDHFYSAILVNDKSFGLARAEKLVAEAFWFQFGDGSFVKTARFDHPSMVLP